ncbi:hypothetical protein MJ3_08080 [Salimicrobium jeotgali]|uniref:Uncharacterized protein n=1 Tax=Salimicrobium jeotgali TaxID=1230341 RepID=K2GM18_9BACI|nr:hypothetical protein MJ3_08080 [Salimicrobium jeotgali]
MEKQLINNLRRRQAQYCEKGLSFVYTYVFGENRKIPVKKIVTVYSNDYFRTSPNIYARLF